MGKILRMLFTGAITGGIVIGAFMLFHRVLGFWTMALIVVLVPVGFWIAQMIVDVVWALIEKLRKKDVF